MTDAPTTVPGLLVTAAERFGDRPFLRSGDVRRTYRESAEAAARTAGALAARGVRRGDRVAVMAENRPEFLDLVFGCAWLGAVLVPLNTGLRRQGLRHALDVAEPPYLVAEPGHAARLAEAGYRGALWLIGRDEPSPREAPPCRPAPVRPEETAAILFTSGTTGASRGVRCPHAQFGWWGANVADSLRLDCDDVLYTCLPLFHTNALNALAQALVSGASYTLGPHFSASRYWGRVAEADATVLYLLGAMVPMLMAQPPGPQDRAHRAWRALAPATPAHLWEHFRERFGVTLVDGFGSTETNLVIGTGVDESRPGFMGTLRDGFSARVVGEHLAPVPDGTPGELVVRTGQPYAFSTGYVGDPAEPPGSWRRTGDRVVREADGRYRFVDRIKDVIRRRGENVSSHEVETAVRTHPSVAEAAAFPVPSDLAEDEVMVTVVVRPGHAADPADLVRHCERELPPFAVPRYIDFVPALPMTETGKVRKATLREQGVTSTTWNRP
ncbi:ATP-dependent acyl-CoA ligase [Actinomadura sp. KC345]|uniref:AMP-binding protein n=1 Tax=Actinomadura sp. KC345 TaxID=2530371 RepID=UPI0010471420|nr:AMP-binding protein [Actinomadura sp. KC345]TDC46546.1 ATP-dependent acyl-CoA ligase [Actinomadura sp. KC345]